jgi:hypothetical protein
MNEYVTRWWLYGQRFKIMWPRPTPQYFLNWASQHFFSLAFEEAPPKKDKIEQISFNNFIMDYMNSAETPLSA